MNGFASNGQEPISGSLDQRETPRESDHLDGFEVRIQIGAASVAAQLVDESITGVGVRMRESTAISVDTSVQVRHGANVRDAIVQRVWTDADGAQRLGLTWRAAHFR